MSTSAVVAIVVDTVGRRTRRRRRWNEVIGDTPAITGVYSRRRLKFLCVPSFTSLILFFALKMGKKASKASRKYAASGQLKKEIESRKKHQQIKRNIERKRTGKPKEGGFDKENVSGQRKGKEKAEDPEEDDDAEEEGSGSDGETGQ